MIRLHAFYSGTDSSRLGVVINATERSIGQEYAALTSAVRTLVDKYQLRVVVDGSPNSLDESLLRTTRERVIDIKPMTTEMIRQIDQLQDLFRFSKQAGLDDVLFSVLGGIPFKYEKLWKNAEQALKDGENPRQVIGFHLCEHISDAIKIVRNSKINEKDMNEIIKLFDKENDFILCDTLGEKNLKRPCPDKVFVQVGRDGKYMVPASNAIATHSFGRALVGKIGRATSPRGKRFTEGFIRIHKMFITRTESQQIFRRSDLMIF